MAINWTAPEPGRMDHHHGPQPGDRPPPQGVFTSRPVRTGGIAARPRRTDRGGRRARRPAEADLYVLSPRAWHACPGRADAPAAWRGHHRRDRTRLSSFRADDGSAPGPSQGKIRDARIPYRVPNESDLPARLQAVLAVIYLIFNEGYTASSGNRLVRDDLCKEAIRLARLLTDLMPEEPEVRGLLALMLLIESRRAARTTPEGEFVLLGDQDRGRWDRTLISEGQAIVRECLRRNRPGPYQIQAAINAVHSDASVAGATDWWQIVQLYNQLIAFAPSPVVALNRAVAVAEVEGPDAALTIVDGLDLGGFYLFHAVRADLLRRLGRSAEAALAYEAAIALTENATERAFLERSHQSLSA